MRVSPEPESDLRLDLRILVATALIVLRRQGISQPGHATAEKFTGTTAAEPAAK